LITINPGGANEEQNQIAGFGSIILVTPLKNPHAAGEAVVETAAPEPTATPTRTATATSTPAPPAACLTLGQKTELIIGIIKRFGAERGERRYKAKYDVNGTGIIGILDIEMVLDTPTCRPKHHHHHHHHWWW